MLSTFGTQIYRYTVRDFLSENSRKRSRRQRLAVAKAILEGDGAKEERLMRRHVRVSCEEALKPVDAGI